MNRRTLLLLIFLFALNASCQAQSQLYPYPDLWSFESIASRSLPRPKLVETLPPVGNARSGDLLFLENSPAPALCYNNGSAWSVVGATGSQSGGAGPFFQFMNVATTPFSIPVIGRMGSWTAAPFARAASSGNSLSDSPTCFDPGVGQISTIIASVGPAVASGAEQIYFTPLSTKDGVRPVAYNVELALDGDYDTYATIWYDPSWGSTGYPAVWASQWYTAGNITGLAIMFSKNTAFLPTVITARDGMDEGPTIWTASQTPFSCGGKWFFSPQFSKRTYGYFFRFQPSSTTAATPWGTNWRKVEIAEIRLIDHTASASSVFGAYSYPQVLPLLHPDPASATFDGFVVRGQTATPTARVVGTLWVDTNLSPPRIKFWNGSSWTSM